MGKLVCRLKDLLPTQRRLIQLYAALLHNAHIKGFIDGSIYTGKGKMLCVPGLNCYSCPGAVGACPLGSLQNAIAASQSRSPVYVIGILMLLGLTLGRTVCGNLCPMGLFQELVHKLPTPKLKKSRVTRVLSRLKYGILAVFVLGIPLWYSFQSHPVPAFCKYICPAGTLEGALGLLSHPDNADSLGLLGGLFTWKFLVLLLTVLGCVFIYRAFCRFICPLGAIYGLFSRIALIGVKVDAAGCTDCGRCVGVCKTDIRRVGDGECIHCGECIDVCPTGAISLKAGRITLRGPQAAPVPPKKKKRALWVRLGAWAAALAVLGFGLWFFNRPVREPEDGPSTPVTVAEEGMTAPELSVSVYGGEPFSISEQRGRITVINFWATWCTPCCEELPYFERVALEYGDQVSVIAVHSHLVTDDVQGYLDQHGYRMTFGQDGDGEFIAAFGGELMLPQTVIIDARGVVTYNRTGSLTYESLVALLEDAGLRR